MSDFHHLPVMVERIVELFAPVPPGLLIDATVGGGGHASALLAAHPQLRLLGLDQDEQALAAAAATLAAHADEGRVALRHARFDQLTTTLQEFSDAPVAGVLFDLGVSSPQLDVAERGFSYRLDAALDMRMDRSQPHTAADVVNTYDELALRRVLHDHGDERHAGRIARAIVRARPISTTGQLAEVVRDAIPAPARRRGGHPAKRSFQAIRIEVNRELEVLPSALDQAVSVLQPRGRCAVLSYHSGEDRIVKETFRTAATGGCECPPGLPCTCGAAPVVRLLKRGAWKADGAETARNRRAGSARLRAVEKLDLAGDDGGGDEAA